MEHTVGTQPILALPLSVEILTRLGELLNSISHKVAPEEEVHEEAEVEEEPVGEVPPRPTLHQLQG